MWLLSLEGTVLEVNDAALALGGLEGCEAVGQPLAQGSAWGFMGYGQQQLQRAIAAAANGQTIHCKIETKPGDLGAKKLQLTVRPVSEEGRPVLLIIEGKRRRNWHRILGVSTGPTARVSTIFS